MVYDNEQIAAMLEKAASEIERLQKENEELKQKIEGLNSLAPDFGGVAVEGNGIEKTAGFSGESLGGPSALSSFNDDPKKALESFLSGLA